MDFLNRFSKLRLGRFSLVAGLMVALGLAAGLSRPREAADDIMPKLGLKSGELITIDQAQMGKSEMAIQMNGQDYVIDYTFQSIRSKQFRLMVQQENGELVEQVAPAVNTIRGTLKGVKGSRVVGCINEDGCCAKIQFPSGEHCYMEPVSRVTNDPAFTGVHVVYTEDDVIPSEGQCGTATNLAEAEAEQNLEGTPRTARSTVLQECELTLDSDFEYFSIFGSVNATLTRMELIINIMNDQYESEVGIRHTVVTAVVRQTANTPYTETDSSDLLNQLRNEYRFTGFDGDLCHLFTGKNLDGTTVGLAFVGSVCSNNSGYGLSQNLNGVSRMTDLVAHEIGHNWNQSHCSCVDHTMNARLTGANDFNDTITVPRLIAYRDTRRCLDSITSPANDDWVNRSSIANADFSVTGSNIAATTEADEQNLLEVGSSVWWSVNADEDGTVTIDTSGSDFDTQLYIYEFVPGGDLRNLILIDENDDINFDANNIQSEVTFDVAAGTQYAIRVGGFRDDESIGDGSEGNVVLNGVFTPTPILLGDVNLDRQVDFSDIGPFILILSNDGFQAEADTDQNEVVDFSDIAPFIVILNGT
ncbi:zinc-dependent metalloprotease [Mariniblastus sp.]|nr:zinc-dependent metalloprotease [Mariniblastus sp.]